MITAEAIDERAAIESESAIAVPKTVNAAVSTITADGYANASPHKPAAADASDSRKIKGLFFRVASDVSEQHISPAHIPKTAEEITREVSKSIFSALLAFRRVLTFAAVCKIDDMLLLVHSSYLVGIYYD